MNLKTLKSSKSLIAATLFGFGFLVSAHTTAASLSYNLTLSNGNPYIPDGTPYAQVIIDDEGSSGLINFTVTILDSILDDNKTSNYGLQSFGFNVSGAAALLTVDDVINLPTGTSKDWSAKANSNQNGFGNFDMTVVAGERLDPTLTFSTNLGLDQSATDSILDYVATNTDGFVFAAHISGFEDLNPNPPVDGCVDLNPPDEDWSPQCNILTSVYVATDSLTPVPVPAAVWLFGSGLLGLAGIARRRNAQRCKLF
jgi:hypothetical protein